MKAKVFFLTIVFAFSQLSFGNDFSKLEQETSIDEKSTDILYILGSGGKYVNGVLSSFPPELVFTGEEIVSFNLTTREIVLTDPVSIKLISGDNEKKAYWQLYFYFNDKPLFEKVLIVSSLTSSDINDLVFYIIWPSNQFYLNDGYPPTVYEYWPDELREIFIKEREDNAEKRKAEWDIFIQYLSNTGKIVGNETAIEPIATPEINDISIYPNPTKGELGIKNYELGIDNVEVFDIYGIKQLAIFNFQFSTQIDISHLPTGIYFVRITTEKGVVTKKIVKR